MPMNLNEAPEYREVGAMIPDGTFCWVNGKVRPGNVSIPNFDPMDAGLFKQSTSSDVVYADWEFTVVHGPHAGSKIWQNLSMAGGEMDDKGQSKAGNISKAFYRGMIESAFGIDPKATDPQSQAYRNVPGVKALESVTFAVRTGVELGGDDPKGGKYPDKTIIAKIILPGDPQYAALRAGQEVAPAPTGPRAARGQRSAASGTVAPGQSPLWQTDAGAHAPQAAPAPAPAAAPASPAQAWTGQAPAPQAAPAPAGAWPGANGAAAPASAPAGGPAPGGAPASGPEWLRQ